MKKRFLRTMAVFGVLAALASTTLDGNWRLAVLILLGGLATRTFIAYKAGW